MHDVDAGMGIVAHHRPVAVPDLLREQREVAAQVVDAGNARARHDILERFSPVAECRLVQRADHLLHGAHVVEQRLGEAGEAVAGTHEVPQGAAAMIQHDVEGGELG